MARVSRPLRERVFARSDGHCQKCGAEIEFETFHASHKRSAASGGIEHESNLEAWCQSCNLTQGSRDAGDPRITPREWQLAALDPIVRRITRDGAATLSAAPGAGKTVFAGLTYETLRENDVVDRLVVLVPRLALVEQWVEALATACHIQLKPGSTVTRRGQEGVVLTYQSLLNRDTIEALLAHPHHARTLFVFDEVHHAGEHVGGQLAWSRAITELVGDLDNLQVNGVLNMSGTLWRSDPRERIPTVRYRMAIDGKLESLVDYRVDVEQLVLRKELRPIDLYRLGAQVKLADYRDLAYVEGNLADLDEREARATLRGLAGKDSWLESFVSSVLDRLEASHRALDGYHCKALIVAANVADARRFHAEVDRQQVARKLPRLAAIATSDDKNPHTTLRNFREQRRVGVLCVVDMAGEGYDCPDIAVVGYATNKLTTLYVRQVVARAMRVTVRERDLERVLPAAIVLPDSDLIVEQLVGYLGPYVQELLPTDEGGPAPGDDGDGTGLRMPGLTRFELEDAATNERDFATVAYGDGSTENIEVELIRRLGPELEKVNISAVYAPRLVAAARRTIGNLIDSSPFDAPSADAEALGRISGKQPTPASVEPVVLRRGSIEQQATMLQRRCDQRSRWWAVHGDEPASHFNRLANQAGGIRDGGRAGAAPEQLARALAWMEDTIRDYCKRTSSSLPKELRDEH
jgi:superfamily II DNA or RNA helicase